MSAAIDFPAGLPCPLYSGFGLQHVSPLERTELVTGRARQRRRYTSVPTFADVAWRFSQSQAQIFEAWFKYTTIDGAEWFNCKLRTPIGLKDYECRFVGMYEGPELIGRQYWEISAQLEIRERQTIDPVWLQFQQFVLGSDIIDRALNREWPQ